MRSGGIDNVTNTIVLCSHALSSSWEAELSVKPERFERQVELLVERGYRGVKFSEAVHAGGDEKTLAITFDDAFRSVSEIAWPDSRASRSARDGVRADGLHRHDGDPALAGDRPMARRSVRI